MNKATVLALVFTIASLMTGLGYYFCRNSTTTSTEIPASVFDLWNHWKGKYNKKYGAEDQQRLTIFYENYQKVMTHQKNPSRTYDMGFTKFMDLTKEEFKARYLSTNIPKTGKNVEILPTENLPPSVDWRSKGAVTPVKNQQQCGSCWAFSSTGALEGLSFLSGKGLQSFSEQQLVDCSKPYGNNGCQGGLMDYAFQYVHDHGVSLESEYPYSAQDGTCKKDGGAFRIRGYTDVKKGDYNQLKAAIAQRPVSVAVDAENWQFYSGGVFSDCSNNLDHGVLAVGYTSSAWIVKNSWDTNWGEDGYIRVSFGNTCGIADSASYPTA